MKQECNEPACSGGIIGRGRGNGEEEQCTCHSGEVFICDECGEPITDPDEFEPDDNEHYHEVCKPDED